MLRSLWKKIRGKSDGAGQRGQIEKQWADERGTLLQLSRTSPGAIATYKINWLESDEAFLLLCDELQPLREWLRGEGVPRRLRVPREFECGILDALNHPQQTHVIVVAWQSKSLHGSRHRYRVLGIYSVDLSATHSPRDRIAIHRIVFRLWEWEIQADLWSEVVDRINYGTLIASVFARVTEFPVNLKKHA